MAKKSTRKSTPTEPWDEPQPAAATKNKKTLTPAHKAAAKKAATRAGRPYPNMVDNMREAAKQSPARKSPIKKRAAKKR